MRDDFGQNLVVAVVSAIVGAVITGGVAIYLNTKTEDQMRIDTENAIVQALSDEFDDITTDMSYKDAYGQMKKDIDDLRTYNHYLEAEIEKLESLPKVIINSVDVKRNGVIIQRDILDGWVVIDGMNYYSEDTVNSILGSTIIFDEETKTLVCVLDQDRDTSMTTSGDEGDGNKPKAQTFETNESIHVLSKDKLQRWVEKTSIQNIAIRNTIKDIPSSAVDLSEAGDKSVFGWMDNNTLCIVSDGEIYAPDDSSYLFSFYSSLHQIEGLNYIRTDNVKSMKNMFCGCCELLKLDLNSWNTTNVTDMYGMFSDCRIIKELQISEWNTTNVTDMSWMFSKCRNLEELTVDGWDTKNVVYMKFMFSDCTKLRSLDVLSWNTDSMVSTSGMFNGTYWEHHPLINK